MADITDWLTNKAYPSRNLNIVCEWPMCGESATSIVGGLHRYCDEHAGCAMDLGEHIHKGVLPRYARGPLTRRMKVSRPRAGRIK